MDYAHGNVIAKVRMVDLLSPPAEGQSKDAADVRPGWPSAAATMSTPGRCSGDRLLFGGLFGVRDWTGFLVLPGIGRVMVAGPVAAVLRAGIEGALAGTGLGSPPGALVGCVWSALVAQGPDRIDLHDPPAF